MTLVGVLLRQDGFEASFDELAAVVSHNCDGYEIVWHAGLFGLPEPALLELLCGKLTAACVQPSPQHARQAPKYSTIYG